MTDFNLEDYAEEDRFHATVLRIVELLKSVDTLGVTHIVSGDGNMEDDNLAFVERVFAHNEVTNEEKQLISLLKSIPVEVREVIWILHDYVSLPK